MPFLQQPSVKAGPHLYSITANRLINTIQEMLIGHGTDTLATTALCLEELIDSARALSLRELPLDDLLRISSHMDTPPTRLQASLLEQALAADRRDVIPDIAGKLKPGNLPAERIISLAAALAKKRFFSEASDLAEGATTLSNGASELQASLLERALAADRRDVIPDIAGRVKPGNLPAERALSLAAALVKKRFFSEASGLAEAAIALSNGAPESQMAGIGILFDCKKIRTAVEACEHLPSTAWSDMPTMSHLGSSIVLHLLEKEAFEKAARLAQHFLVEQWLGSNIPADTKIRIAFIADVLLDVPQHLTSGLLHAIDQPSVSRALAPYFHPLSRRAEMPLRSLIDVKAVNWIAQALHIECEHLAYPKNTLFELMRWLVLADRPKDAIRIMEIRYDSDPSLSDGYTYLALFLLARGDEFQSDACHCLSRERLDETNDSDLLFLRTAALMLSGQQEKAIPHLMRLYASHPKYFMENRSPTVWGVLACVFRSCGQNAQASKASDYAEIQDPYNHFRRRTFDRIRPSAVTIPLPPFELPF
jgi:tetratricopeptide (TPR) repeat protein